MDSTAEGRSQLLDRMKDRLCALMQFLTKLRKVDLDKMNNEGTC